MTRTVEAADGADQGNPVVDPARQPASAVDGEPAAGGGSRHWRRNRSNRWDRPAEPRDWRWAVGHFGRTMITLGLLMFGFVAYQLWGTGIQTARDQDRLTKEFAAVLESTTVPIAPATTTTLVVPESTSITAGAEPSNPTSVPIPTEASETTAVPVTAPGPIIHDWGAIEPGDALMFLDIPKADVHDDVVVADVGVKQLRMGPGHFSNTSMPGELGNAALAGHRTSNLAPFSDLDELELGDEIKIRTIFGEYIYLVTGSEVVEPTDVHVITDSDPTIATLTLITCTPKGSSTQRLVVHATLDPARSGPVGAPTSYYGLGRTVPAATVLPSDDPVPTAAEDPVGTVDVTSVATDVITTSAAASATETTPAAEVANTSGGTTSASTSASTSTSTAPQTTDARPSVAIVDPPPGFSGQSAFGQGWFDDGAALPHVAGWALLLGSVAYGSYRFAKRYRRLYLAFVVGFVPVVVILYFFYENVNRLLPAAI